MININGNFFILKLAKGNLAKKSTTENKYVSPMCTIYENGIASISENNPIDPAIKPPSIMYGIVGNMKAFARRETTDTLPITYII